MDSLTQIVLGAACGEVVLGKKIGNRALLWGGIAGTIPDLDVLLSPFVNAYDELAIHRGFSHSIVFAILGAFVFPHLINFIYQSKYHRYIATLGWSLFPLATLYFVSRIFEGESAGITGIVILISLCLGLIYWIYRNYFIIPFESPNATLNDWRKLFFWSLMTHPILDCFTTYGTQLFLPFTSYRVAFNAVAVADPVYTLPFLICIVICSFLVRENSWRRGLAIGGLTISSLYLVLTVINKARVNEVVIESLKSQNIEYNRFMTSPTILNNILWNCIVETDSAYYSGLYSFFDHEKNISFQRVPKNYEFLAAKNDDRVVKRIAWFSKGYYTVSKESPDVFHMNDMRFGFIDQDGKPYYIFHFPVQKNNTGNVEMLEIKGGPPPGERDNMISELWARIKGI